MQDLIQSFREAKEFITTLARTAWNSFFENIWKKRCELVSNWEKLVGISSADKKKKKESTPSAGSSNKETHEKEEDIVRDQVNRTGINRKEEDDKSIQKVWLGSVYDWISNRMRPFFWGLDG